MTVPCTEVQHSAWVKDYIFEESYKGSLTMITVRQWKTGER